MPVSDILQIPVLTESMAQKTIGVNMAIQAMEKVITGILEIPTVGVDTSGESVLIPFDTTNDFSPREALRAIFYRVLAGATANFDLIHPSNPHLFIIENQTNQDIELRTADLTADMVIVPPTAVFLVYCDGVNMTKIDFSLVNLIQAHDFNFAFYGKPADDQIMGRVIIARETVFPANLSGSRGRVDANPLASHSLRLFDDATQFGTITIDVNGAYTFATNGGNPHTAAAGSVITLRNALTADPLLDVVECCITATQVIAQPIP